MSAKWYIVHAYSGFEKKVAQAIKEQAELSEIDEIEDVLVPTEEVVQMRRGQKINSERKFFPGYVLVRMELSDVAYHMIKNTPKVAGFLGTGGRPSPITQKEADRIMHQVQHVARNASSFRATCWSRWISRTSPII